MIVADAFDRRDRSGNRPPGARSGQERLPPERRARLREMQARLAELRREFDDVDPPG